MEHEQRAERLEQEAERLDEHSDEVAERIEDARRDWEAKAEDASVPGAQSEAGDREESDQLPEEGPEEQVPEDTEGETREEAGESAGVPGEEETGTGNPDAAGAEDPEEE